MKHLLGWSNNYNNKIGDTIELHHIIMTDKIGKWMHILVWSKFDEHYQNGDISLRDLLLSGGSVQENRIDNNK